MPAGQFTPGPIDHYVLFRGAQVAEYLGTAVMAPEQEAEDFKIPILNDLGGRSVPFQLVQDGEQWMIQTTLNRFDFGVYRSIRDRISAGPGQPTALGSETGRARGTLVIGSSDFSLILVNTYAGTPSSGLPIGVLPPLNALRGFYSSTLLKYKESTVGTRVLELALLFQCNNVFDPISRGFGLYSEAAGSFTLGPRS